MTASNTYAKDRNKLCQGARKDSAVVALFRVLSCDFVVSVFKTATTKSREFTRRKNKQEAILADLHG
jgi:hypothetical protein